MSGEEVGGDVVRLTRGQVGALYALRQAGRRFDVIATAGLEDVVVWADDGEGRHRGAWLIGPNGEAKAAGRIEDPEGPMPA